MAIDFPWTIEHLALRWRYNIMRSIQTYLFKGEFHWHVFLLQSKFLYIVFFLCNPHYISDYIERDMRVSQLL